MTTAVLAASLFFCHPAPLDMPRASAYLVSDTSGARRLEDRYDELDLWTSRAVLGRWTDDEGRVLTVSKLDAVAPKFLGSAMTRSKYMDNVAKIGVRDRDESPRLEAIEKLSPFPLPEDDPVPPKHDVHGIKSALYYHGTNTTSLVCAFLPEESRAWYLVVWDLLEGDATSPGDDIDVAKESFEEEFLGKWDEIVKTDLRSEIDFLAERRAYESSRSKSPRPAERKDGEPKRKKADPADRERELLRADAHHSVTNYQNWHSTDAREFTVLDDLPPDSTFVATLTNELGTMRAKYAAAFPTPLESSNVLAVARIFRSRGEYLEALDVNDHSEMKWSAAYWSPSRRELVAYLPQDGAEKLLETIRHEAFHQYLSYACAMMSASPWINEGYAQYFENEASADWGMEVDIDQLAEMLPVVMTMDYGAFYDGSDLQRRLKYRMAWSMAYFLEKGAPNVRFAPFKDVKSDYVKALLKHGDKNKATEEAFGTPENMRLFVSEWKKFWKAM